MTAAQLSRRNDSRATAAHVDRGRRPTSRLPRARFGRSRVCGAPAAHTGGSNDMASFPHQCPYAIEESTRQPPQWRHCCWPTTAGREHMRQMCSRSTVAAWLRRRARGGTSALVPLRLKLRAASACAPASFPRTVSARSRSSIKVAGIGAIRGKVRPISTPTSGPLGRWAPRRMHSMHCGRPRCSLGQRHEQSCLGGSVTYSRERRSSSWLAADTLGSR